MVLQRLTPYRKLSPTPDLKQVALKIEARKSSRLTVRAEKSAAQKWGYSGQSRITTCGSNIKTCFPHLTFKLFTTKSVMKRSCIVNTAPALWLRLEVCGRC